MPNFRYTATNPLGQWISGERRGEGRDQVEAQLRGEGLSVETLSEAESAREVPIRAATRRDMIELVEQLTTLTRSGLPLPSGLRAASQEIASGPLRSIFRDLADRLERGDGLDESLAASSDRLPATVRGLVLAGAGSNRLADLLGEYVRQANLGADLRRRFWSSLAYPLVVTLAVLALVYAVCNLSVRAVDSILDGLPDLGQQRQGQVDTVVSLARMISNHGLKIAIGGVLALGAVWATLRFAMRPAARRHLVCQTPLIGPLLRFTALTEFCHLLAMLLEAELPLPLAFELAGSTVHDAELAEACDRVGAAVATGQPLSEAVKLWTSIPAGLGPLFLWSEGHRNLPQALHLAGDMFEARARSQENFSRSVLATFLVLLILWWIGFAIAALYLPLLTLISRLSG